jgi:hypothetical protein
MNLLIMIGYAVAIAAVTALIHHLRPTWETSAIGALVTFPVPAVVMLTGLYLAGVEMSTPAPPGETDASGMVIMVYMLGGMFVAGTALLVGGAASLLTPRQLRKRR